MEMHRAHRETVFGDCAGSQDTRHWESRVDNQTDREPGEIGTAGQCSSDSLAGMAVVGVLWLVPAGLVSSGTKLLQRALRSSASIGDC